MIIDRGLFFSCYSVGCCTPQTTSCILSTSKMTCFILLLLTACKIKAGEVASNYISNCNLKEEKGVACETIDIMVRLVLAPCRWRNLGHNGCFSGKRYASRHKNHKLQTPPPPKKKHTYQFLCGNRRFITADSRFLIHDGVRWTIATPFSRHIGCHESLYYYQKIYRPYSTRV